MPEADDELAALQLRIEQILLGGERKYTRVQAADKAGVTLDRASALWRALGFATTDSDEPLFTDGDVHALQVTAGLMDAGILDPQTATSAARMLGQHLSRLAEWQVHMLRTVIEANPEIAADERQLARFIERLLPDLEQMQSFAWRRHLAAFAGRVLAARDDFESRQQVVGFADMVGYTSLTRRASEAELGALLERFESVASAVITDNHGQVVKMLGDEVLFVTEDPVRGATIALTLLEAAEADDDLPSLRCGMAFGRVLGRYGDVYGSTVNLASRLTSVARPGTVLVDVALADALSEVDDFAVRSRRPVSVRGYHRLKPSVLRRASDEQAGLLDLAQQRAAELLGLEEDAEDRKRKKRR
jgi:adenylate cyclase